MKKLFFLLFIALFITSCNFNISNDDQQVAWKNLEEVLISISNKDESQIKKLFAADCIGEISEEEFFSNIEDLFQYCDWEFEKIEELTLSVENDSHYGAVKEIYEISADVITSKGKYRIALFWVTEDNTNSGNKGIHSLYIIDYEVDPYQDHAYWGDTQWTLGINLGTFRTEPYPGE